MNEMNIDVLMYFQTNYYWIMSEGKTSRSGRNLRETVRFGHDPATHTTFIAKTMKCKVKLYLNWVYHCKILCESFIQEKKAKIQVKKAKREYDRDRYTSNMAKPSKGKTKRKSAAGKNKSQDPKIKKKWIMCCYI